MRQIYEHKDSYPIEFQIGVPILAVVWMFIVQKVLEFIVKHSDEEFDL